ncbi:MAG: hypothetical protein FWE37_02175 [Spirochaetaceae bacterium]|nr:hypothetical protein [Spirochaetaceae bacterium]
MFIKKILVLALIAVVITGCVSTDSSARTSSGDPISDFVSQSRRNAPEGAIMGVGIARIGTAGRQQAMTISETRGRAEIARQVEVVVTNMITDFVQSSEANPAAALSFQESVTRTLSQQTQRGARIYDQRTFGDEVVTVVILSVADLRREVASASQSAAALAPHMANAQWALERMDQALANINAQPPVLNSGN